MCCARHNGDNALEKPTSSLCSFSVVLCPNVLLYEQVVRMANDLSADDGKPLLRVVAKSIEQMNKQISKQDKSPSEIDFYTNYATLVDANLSNEIIPRVGMEFNTEQDVYDFYNKYAKERTINLAQAAELEIVDRSGLAPKESVEFLARKFGGIENLGFIPKDYSNYLRTRKTKEMRVGDTGGVLSFQNFKQVPNQYILKIWTKEAKIGVTINSSTSTRSNDPKVDVGTGYKILLRWYSHLAARAAMSEQSFKIAMDDGEKTLSKVETTLKQLSIEESFNTCGEKMIFPVDASDQNENNEKNIKWIKCKPRKKKRREKGCQFDQKLL
ncbi:hypothetical protein V6N12_058727 [Hibiscus sabdariffa]|uniref:Protein FAR1-RELATED SEQUENCE n=1 Tax=Hibiscus sabdariffa TaxID=183260 RepID=A0ABR2ET09_9ROSI